MEHDGNRRSALKQMGLIGSAVPTGLALASTSRAPIKAPVTFIVIGAGSRGSMYSTYALDHPDEMKLVGVAEPNVVRRERAVAKYKIDPKLAFDGFASLFATKQKLADAVIISTPDQLHHAPAMRAMELGYQVILEKPIAPTAAQCQDILRQAKRHNSIVAVCHVLRYTAYYRQLKEWIDAGLIGDVVTVDQVEPVGYWHVAHSFVRGNWRNTKQSSPMLLAKSCHDMDILRWLIGKPARRIASFGSLKHFRKENAPKGSTARCTDGCAIERECPYSAIKLYMDMKRTSWPVDVITEDMSEAGRMKAIKEGPYGRCVYHCDNDVVDHQVVSIEFADGITASFNMSGFTSSDQGRRTHVMGTLGDIRGDFKDLKFTNFRNGEVKTFSASATGVDAAKGHGGGDLHLVHDFIRAVVADDPGLLSSTLDASIESHSMCFAGERSRLEGKVVPV